MTPGADVGGGVEVCDDGIDNDKGGEIDECDGGDVGVTPKGASNTFNVDLVPGTHTIRITCLDDGGVPLGNDIGTACVSVVVYGTDAGIGGGALEIAYGGAGTVSFEVPEGPAVTTVPQNFDGSTPRGLE